MRRPVALIIVTSWVVLVASQANAQPAAPGSITRAAQAGNPVRTWSALAPGATREGGQAASIVDDPVTNGIGWGALIGAGAGVGAVAVAYARCDAGCEAPEPFPMYLLGGSVGAGTGALIGWLVDRAHTSRPPTARAVSVAPVVARRHKAVAVKVRF